MVRAWRIYFIATAHGHPSIAGSLYTAGDSPQREIAPEVSTNY